MKSRTTTYPFEAHFDELLEDPERYVDAVFSCLESEFLIMPKGIGFVDYPVFERGYEALKTATEGFSHLDPVAVFSVIMTEPISMVVFADYARVHALRVGVRDYSANWSQCYPGVCSIPG
jgi:hypothetical protein